MDHRWGRNVGDLGVSGQYTTLAARLSMFPYLVVTNGGWFTPNQFVLWVVSLDTDVAWDYFVFEKSTFGGRFPYGLDVEPDADV